MSISCGRLVILGLASLAALAAGNPLPAAETVLVPEARRPPVLDRVGVPTRLLALDVSADGTAALTAVLAAENPDRTGLLLYDAEGGDPAVLEVPGRVRDVFLHEDGSILALVHTRPRKKKRAGSTALIHIEPELRRPREVLRLPPSASDLEPWAARGLLLVACTDDVRSIVLENLRSGPVFRVVGPNRAITALAASDVVLIGQAATLLLVNLGDAPREYRMPIRERVSVPAAVEGLASSRDGSRALARLADGSVLGVRFGPLRVEPEAAAALAVLSFGRGGARVPVPVAALPEPESPSPPVASAPAPPAEQTDVTGTAPAPEPAAPPEPAPPAPVLPTGEPLREAQPPVDDPPVVQPPQAAGPPGPDARSPAPSARVRGRLEGTAVPDVDSVVLFGPDNILREAARARPDEAGFWFVEGLDPGRYRVQVDGGGSRVLVTDPPFLTLDVPETGQVEAAVLRVVRSL